MRPIFITSLTLMAGAFAILQDPIFNGMAISLLFGAGVATVMAVIIIPLGCISARRQFYVETSDDGNVKVSAAYEMVEHEALLEKAEKKSGPSLLMRLWGGIFSLFSWIFLMIKAVFTMIGMGLKSLFGRSGQYTAATATDPVRRRYTSTTTGRHTTTTTGNAARYSQGNRSTNPGNTAEHSQGNGSATTGNTAEQGQGNAPTTAGNATQSGQGNSSATARNAASSEG
jgi:hypothetical protein